MDLTFSLDSTHENIENLVLYILIISTILGWITIIIIFLMVKKTTNPLNNLKKSFEDLIHSNNTNIKFSVTTQDEIGAVAKLFNQYMEKINQGLHQDEKVIEEANQILEKISQGHFTNKVDSVASNPYVEDLKNKLNNMIIHTKNTLDKINTTLQSYSNSQFDTKMDIENLEGDLGLVANRINQVGNNTSQMLSLIMESGNFLNTKSKVLSSASSILSQSSSTQASSLDDTTKTLEKVTLNIKENTQISSQMALLAKDVTQSAKNGSELANETAKSMEEINIEVNSIHEAIEVIDQIAFQTNILSLNAAVEAATAGESGKGFAVVAAEVRNLATRSADAAREIKEIVERANLKASQGKEISLKMIEGYDKLNSNINTTIEMIESVNNASKAQEKEIVNINESINSIDIITQDNATEANRVSNMSEEIEQISNSLVEVASKAKFLK